MKITQALAEGPLTLEWLKERCPNMVQDDLWSLVARGEVRLTHDFKIALPNRVLAILQLADKPLTVDRIAQIWRAFDNDYDYDHDFYRSLSALLEAGEVHHDRLANTLSAT